LNHARGLTALFLCICFLVSVAGYVQAGGGSSDPQQIVKVKYDSRRTVSLRNMGWPPQHTYSLRLRYTYDGEVFLDKTYKDGQTLDEPQTTQPHLSGKQFTIEVWLYNDAGQLLQHGAKSGTPRFTDPSPGGNIIGVDVRQPDIDVYLIQWRNGGGYFVLDMIVDVGLLP
jgi:hypothetical protein